MAGASLPGRLQVEPVSLAERLVTFLQDTIQRRFGFHRVTLGLSGGVDSATVAHLCARALGPQNVLALRLPYRQLESGGLERAQALIDSLGLSSETVDITPIVDAYDASQPEMDWHRRGNVQARARSMVLFDKLTQHDAFPVGTGNRTEILFGYFTQGGDDLPQVNPIGDLYKTQVYELARHLGVPREILETPPSAGLEPDQTDEGDFGFDYATADLVLSHLEGGFSDAAIRDLGVPQGTIDAVRERVRRTYRKRVGTLIPLVQPAPADPTSFFRPRP